MALMALQNPFIAYVFKEFWTPLVLEKGVRGKSEKILKL